MVNNLVTQCGQGLRFKYHVNFWVYLPCVKGRIAQIRKRLEKGLDGRWKIVLKGSNKRKHDSVSRHTNYTLQQQYCY